ncbi:MAG: methionine--tRNA ligase, partial [Nitrosopumilus sp.]|nr:methionine--tRNA ligase [Nitrosopumilus sp.]
MRSKAIITSALPYANGEIHLGHVASTYLPADVTTRFLKLKGVEAYYICASDDFGTPILIQSEKEGKTPSEYVAHWNKRDYDDFTAFGIDFDFFYKTSSTENIAFVQDVFKKLNAAGHIYEKEIIQFYCSNDKKFLPDRYVKGVCPYCNAADQYSDLCESCGRVPEEISDPKCSICGQTPTKEKTSHFFFKLKTFGDSLYKWLDENNNLQKDVKKYVQNWIKSGLIDWDITRDISWGVPVPLEGAKNKVFYGWFDNHLAYISTAVKFLDEKGIDGKEFWNSADIYHFIGKDIVYHHFLFLPAMRLGLNSEYKLPDFIPTRGHLTLQSKKISKSRNWYIGLRQFLEYYPADYLRYYLVAINPYSQDDLNFDWDEFTNRINSELIGNLGNFVNRALGFTKKAFDGVIPETENYDEKDIEA